jgi:hypothetical protein
LEIVPIPSQEKFQTARSQFISNIKKSNEKDQLEKDAENAKERFLRKLFQQDDQVLIGNKLIITFDLESPSDQKSAKIQLLRSIETIL